MQRGQGAVLVFWILLVTGFAEMVPRAWIQGPARAVLKCPAGSSHNPAGRSLRPRPSAGGTDWAFPGSREAGPTQSPCQEAEEVPRALTPCTQNPQLQDRGLCSARSPGVKVSVGPAHDAHSNDTVVWRCINVDSSSCPSIGSGGGSKPSLLQSGFQGVIKILNSPCLWGRKSCRHQGPASPQPGRCPSSSAPCSVLWAAAWHCPATS